MVSAKCWRRLRPTGNRPLRNAIGLSATLVLAGGLFIQACQQDDLAPTGPELAVVAATRTLKVTGGGTGGGRVTAPSAGGAGVIDCHINAGFQVLVRY